MSIVEEFSKLKALDIVIAIAIFLATLSPGFLTLYLFKPHLVFDLDTIKVFLFSAALGLPLFAINFLIFAVLEKERPVHLPKIAIGASIHTIVPFYALLLYGHISPLRFQWFVLGIALVNAIFISGSVGFDKWRRKKKSP